MQGALFPDFAVPAAELEPRGFRYRDGIVTEQEQACLAESLGKLQIEPFELHGHIGNRRVISFGLNYDFSRRSIESANPMPGFLDELLKRAAEFAGRETGEFGQVGVNEYRAGAGVGWHKDKREFGIVVGVSLLGAATMRFRKPDGVGWRRVSHVLKPRSIYILDGAARTEWEHSVPPVSELRYSINFRTLASGVGGPG